jgi:MYXO-CTERM domain-containing protein
MVAGQALPQTITLKNTGTIAWDSCTHLGTTQPRDRDSVFADATWIAANRPAGVTGTVAPGDSFTFKFDFHAPSAPGTYFEYFNLVEDGVAWFSDPGQGGPVDNDLEAQIVVVAGPDSGTDPDAGSGGGEGGGGTAAGAGGEDAGIATPAPIVTTDEDAGVAATSAAPTTGGSTGGAGTTAPTGQSGQSSSGCAVAAGAASGGTARYAMAALGIVALGARRRRGRRGA